MGEFLSEPRRDPLSSFPVSGAGRTRELPQAFRECPDWKCYSRRGRVSSLRERVHVERGLHATGVTGFYAERARPRRRNVLQYHSICTLRDVCWYALRRRALHAVARVRPFFRRQSWSCLGFLAQRFKALKKSVVDHSCTTVRWLELISRKHGPRSRQVEQRRCLAGRTAKCFFSSCEATR